MGIVTLAEIAEILRSVGGDAPFAVEMTGAEVLLGRDAEECVVSLRGDWIEICLPLFAFSAEAAPEIVDWALDLNLRNPDPGRICLHQSAPVLFLLDNLAADEAALRGLSAHIRALWQAAEDLRLAVPVGQATQTVRVTDLGGGEIIFRA